MNKKGKFALSVVFGILVYVVLTVVPVDTTWAPGDPRQAPSSGNYYSGPDDRAWEADMVRNSPVDAG